MEVRKRAIKLLGHVAPKGSWLRGVLRRCARLAQPKDWPHLFYVWLYSVYSALMSFFRALFAWSRRLLSRLRHKRDAT